MKRLIDPSGNSGIGASDSLKLPRSSSPKESTTACPIEIKSLLRRKLRIMFTVGNVDRYIGRRSGRQSIDTRSTLGRLSIESRPSVDRLSIDCRSSIDRHSVDCRPTYMSADIAFQVTDTSPTLGRHFADTWPTLRRYLADTSPILDRYLADTWPTLHRYLTDTRHNQPNHYWRSRDLKHFSLRT